ARSQAFAVRAEDHTGGRPAVPLEAKEFLAGLRIPHLGFTCCMPWADSQGNTRQAFAVRAEDHAAATALDGEEFLAGLGILPLHRSSRSRARAPGFAARAQAFAVRPEAHPGDPAGLSLEGKSLLAGLGIPLLHRVVSRSTGQAFAVRAEGHAAATALDGEEF